MVDRGYPLILLYSGCLNYSKIACFGGTIVSLYFNNYFII